MNLLFISLDAPPNSIWQIKSGEELILLLLAVTLLVGMIVIGIVATYLLVVLRKALDPVPVVAKPADTRSLWQRVSGLHALADEKHLVMDHAYDGIVELDNPTPPWFMGLFYSTISFGVIYLFIFHVLKVGQLQTAEYTQEMALAEVQRDAYIKRVAGSINENTVRFISDAKSLGDGKAIFTQSCVACHGQQGQGGVGPNLTDEYWLHGGSVKAVYHTISEGVVEKGMMSWKKQLNPLQMQQLSSYVLSLQSTKPAGAKEAQGMKEAPALPAPATAQKVAVR